MPSYFAKIQTATSLQITKNSHNLQNGTDICNQYTKSNDTDTYSKKFPKARYPKLICKLTHRQLTEYELRPSLYLQTIFWKILYQAPTGTNFSTDLNTNWPNEIDCSHLLHNTPHPEQKSAKNQSRKSHSPIKTKHHTPISSFVNHNVDRETVW